MSRRWRPAFAALAVTSLACISTTTAGCSGSSRVADRDLARTCGTVVIGGGTFVVEIIQGPVSCARARFMLRHARFRENSGFRGWTCGVGTPDYGFTSLVDGCVGPAGEIQAVPANELPRIGEACRPFTGPGDSLRHSVDFRVHDVSCQAAKIVVERCDDGKACHVGKSTWHCKRPKQKPALGFGERCTSGKRFTSIVWLD